NESEIASVKKRGCCIQTNTVLEPRRIVYYHHKLNVFLNKLDHKSPK
uniref:Uncharacterized protein n=1 Tax=Ciona intestinalis TaxID=7719 RepID=H2XXD2_CIOIN